VILSHAPPCSCKSKEKEKEKKRNINNDLVVLPSHDTKLVTRNYWWPGVTKEVGRYVDGCDTCQRYKNQSEVPVGNLMPNVIPEKP